jgi:hypothetical protein
MKKFLLLALLLVSGGAAFAQQAKGDFQLQAQGAYYNNSFSGVSFSTGTLYFSASKFLTDNVELGIAPFFMFGDFSSTNLSIFGNYSFLTADAKMVPYVGAQLLFTGLGTDPDISQIGFGLKAGLRYFIRENINIDIGPSMSFMGPPEGATEGSTQFVFNFGLGYILKAQ